MNIIKKFVLYGTLALSFVGIGTGLATQGAGTGVEYGSWILEKGLQATETIGHGVSLTGEGLAHGSQYLNTWATNSLRKEEYRDLYFSPYTFSEKTVEQDWVLVN